MSFWDTIIFCLNELNTDDLNGNSEKNQMLASLYTSTKTILKNSDMISENIRSKIDILQLWVLSTSELLKRQIKENEFDYFIIDIFIKKTQNAQYFYTQQEYQNWFIEQRHIDLLKFNTHQRSLYFKHIISSFINSFNVYDIKNEIIEFQSFNKIKQLQIKRDQLMIEEQDKNSKIPYNYIYNNIRKINTEITLLINDLKN